MHSNNSSIQPINKKILLIVVGLLLTALIVFNPNTSLAANSQISGSDDNYIPYDTVEIDFIKNLSNSYKVIYKTGYLTSDWKSYTAGNNLVLSNNPSDITFTNPGGTVKFITFKAPFNYSVPYSNEDRTTLVLQAAYYPKIYKIYDRENGGWLGSLSYLNPPVDTDGDGIPDNEEDNDNDGIPDIDDPYPDDTDNDGTPNSQESELPVNNNTPPEQTLQGTAPSNLNELDKSVIKLVYNHIKYYAQEYNQFPNSGKYHLYKLKLPLDKTADLTTPGGQDMYFLSDGVAIFNINNFDRTLVGVYNNGTDISEYSWRINNESGGQILPITYNFGRPFPSNYIYNIPSELNSFNYFLSDWLGPVQEYSLTYNDQIGSDLIYPTGWTNYTTELAEQNIEKFYGIPEIPILYDPLDYKLDKLIYFELSEDKPLPDSWYYTEGSQGSPVDPDFVDTEEPESCGWLDVVCQTGDLLKWLFIPADDFFEYQFNSFYKKLLNGMGIESHLTNIENLANIKPETPNFSIKLPILNNKEISILNLEFFNKYKETLFNYIRGFFYFLLIMGTLKQLMTLFQKFSFGDTASPKENPKRDRRG